MDHLREIFGLRDSLRVRCDIEWEKAKCCALGDLGASFQHGHHYHEFLRFPEQHGWKVSADYALLFNGTTEEPFAATGSQFVQSWLFFCLLNIVVRGDKPLFRIKDLLDESKTSKPVGAKSTLYLSTEVLKDRIDKWHNWMKADPSKAKLRLIQTDLILEYARTVVRANLDGDAGGRLNVHPTVSLSIMVLGETLSAVKANIQRELGYNIRGWEADDLEGWGYPKYFTDRLNGICPCTGSSLKRQIGSNATLLYAIESHYPDKWRHGERLGCTLTQCKFIEASSQNGNTNAKERGEDYVVPRCDCVKKNKPRCKLVGPEMQDVYEILKSVSDNDTAAKFPVFQITAGNGSRRVTVKEWQRGQNGCEFATISHVWSQGLGNGDSNQVHDCQLDFISDLLKRIKVPGPDLKEQHMKYFWLDTFAIPVPDRTSLDTPKEDVRELKRRAIRQIYHVFDASSHSLVIDRGLCDRDGQFKEYDTVVAIKLLTSAWIRRLWTLQEAFLSREMCVPHQHKFEDIDQDYPGIWFDGLFQKSNPGLQPKEHRSILETTLAGVIKRHLFESLMNTGREARLQTGDPVRERGSDLIASALRSVRWRDTSHREDETIILATLLNLDFRNTQLAQFGGRQPYEDPDGEEAVNQRQDMMKAFLELIEKHYPGSIPAGIIFLPPKRLNKPGFGWAPVTWASGVSEDYPYPLSRTEHPTELRPEGIVVRYPGINLHFETLGAVLDCLSSPQTVFNFPVDRELQEWYQVRITKEGTELRTGEIAGNPNLHHQVPVLAIILSRPRPKGRLAEIGLLVEIYDGPWRRHERQGRLETIAYTRIISRILISRFDKPGDPSAKNQVSSPLDKPGDRSANIQVIGELTKDDQLWCVDDFVSNKARLDDMGVKKQKKLRKKPETNPLSPSPAISSQSDHTSRNSLFSSLWATFIFWKTDAPAADKSPPVL